MRPAEFDGAICLFNPVDGVDESAIRAALSRFGHIESVEFGGWPPVRVRFSSHDASSALMRASASSFCRALALVSSTSCVLSRSACCAAARRSTCSTA